MVISIYAHGEKISQGAYDRPSWAHGKFNAKCYWDHGLGSETPEVVTVETLFSYDGSEYRAETSFRPLEFGLHNPILTPEPSNKTGDVEQAFDLLNKTRAQYGLPPFTLDPKLSHLADLKAKDLVGKDRMSHDSPTYGDIGDMLEGTGLECCRVGENLGRSWTVYEGHVGLMHSSSHRPSILWPAFTDVGIGVADTEVAGETGKILVQVFCQDPKDMEEGHGKGFEEICRW